MARYIELDALVAEIERFKENANKRGAIGKVSTIVLCNELLSFLDTLEVKEVDLEKEKNDYWNKLCDSEFGELLERDAKWFDDIAKHFFELGMIVSNKAQKGE